MKKFVEKYGVLSAKIMTVLSALSYIIYKFIEILSS